MTDINVSTLIKSRANKFLTAHTIFAFQYIQKKSSNYDKNWNKSDSEHLNKSSSVLGRVPLLYLVKYTAEGEWMNATVSTLSRHWTSYWEETLKPRSGMIQAVAGSRRGTLPIFYLLPCSTWVCSSCPAVKSGLSLSAGQEDPHNSGTCVKITQQQVQVTSELVDGKADWEN